MDDHAARPRRLSRREWLLVCGGLVAWVAIGEGGVWLVRELTRTPESCGAPADVPTAQVRNATASPRNAFQLLTGTGKCK
jgi:hypothetical protein